MALQILCDRLQIRSQTVIPSRERKYTGMRDLSQFVWLVPLTWWGMRLDFPIGVAVLLPYTGKEVDPDNAE
jgi:hypothetical protein